MNDGWHIDPAQVTKILNKAETHGQELPGLVRQIESEPTATKIPGATAISEFLSARAEPLRWIDDRITTVVHGTTAALQAYDDGDLTMAAAHQKAAGTIGASAPMPRPRPQPPLGPPTPQ